MAAVPARTSQIQPRLDSLAAELSQDERIWASGYLAGLAAAGQTPQPATGDTAEPAVRASASRVLTVWYGSETGNARRVAEGLAEQAKAQGLAVKLASLADVRPRDIRKQELLTLVVSTHGEGDPPEDAEAFHEFLHSDRAPRLDDLHYTVFALGDSSYEHFCQTGRDLDAALERLGARRVLDRVDADVDFEEAAEAWRRQALESFRELAGGDEGAVAGGEQGARLQLVTGGAPAVSRDAPFEAELLASQPLTVAPSNKSVHHVELTLEGSGLSYQPGDSIGVWAENSPDLVDEILERTGIDGETEVTRKDSTRSVREWLTRYLELTQLSRPFLEQYAEHSGNNELRELIADGERLRGWMRDHQVADVLARFPARLDAETLVQMLRGLTPRLYSIASSPAETPDEVHLTVRTVGGREDGRLRAGNASWHLNEALAEGAGVRVYVEENPRFRLPEDGDTPIIMIGPGTGVAPFRAFIQERRARGDGGANWLFFGEQHRRTDFLYQLEWQRHLRDGALDRISLAFSRDQAEKIYVQDRIREAAAEFNAWLEDGAYVYVCGDAEHMAPAVDRAIVEVIAGQRGVETEEAEQILKQLRRDGLYRKDVY